MGVTEKRCYFIPINQTRDYELFKIESVWSYDTRDVYEEDFIVSYIACFFRDNKDEIEKNYNKIYRIIEGICKEQNE